MKSLFNFKDISSNNSMICKISEHKVLEKYQDTDIMKEEMEKWERVPSWRGRRGGEGGKRKNSNKVFC